MQYGYFDNEQREYVIERVDTPVSWTNYIGTKDMCGVVNQTAEREAARTYIDRLAIKTPSDTVAIRNLSGGNQQKAVLARWLLRDSRLLILDEPTRGVDIGAKREIYEMIEIARTLGASANAKEGADGRDKA